MAKIEVDEEEYRRTAGLYSYVTNLWSNPKARLKIQEAQKLVDPNAKTPDLDAQAVIDEPIAALRKDFKEYIDKTETEKAEAARNAKIESLKRTQDEGFAKLRGESKYTADGIEAVKKVMEEKGILDPLDAAAILEKANPPQTPVTPGGHGGWNFTDLPTEGADYAKRLIDTKGANDLIPEKQAWDAINELRGASRR